MVALWTPILTWAAARGAPYRVGACDGRAAAPGCGGVARAVDYPVRVVNVFRNTKEVYVVVGICDVADKGSGRASDGETAARSKKGASL